MVLGTKACKWLPTHEEVPDEGDSEKSDKDKDAREPTPEMTKAEPGKGGKGGNKDVGKGRPFTPQTCLRLLQNFLKN